MPIDSRIREIITNHGHIKLDDMMHEVLSNNSSSYYQSVENIGKDGDFITSPEISQLFGEIVALWAIEKWYQIGSPKNFTLLELGPGQGKLMQDFLRTAKLVPEFYNSAHLYLLEINPNFIKKQKNNLDAYNKNIEWIDDIKQIPKSPTIIIANEFFDALPIKQYIKIKDKWFESVFVLDPTEGRIKYHKIEINEQLQKQFLNDHKNAQDGAIIEESIKSLSIIRSISKHLCTHKGASLIIDYGYNIKTENRTRSQYNPTLQAIKNHQYHSIIDSLGEADLTAHVDFNALIKAARQKGITNYSISSQQEFLNKYGIIKRAEMLKNNISQEEGNIIDRQVFRLTSPKQMGTLFKALELFH